MPAVHSQSITGAALKARSQVIQSFRVAARPGFAAVAAAAAKEIKLFFKATIHAHQHGSVVTHELGILTQGHGSV